MASSLNNPAWLDWMAHLIAGTSMEEVSMGEVSRQTFAATLPPDRFYCLLDELPLHLIPQPALKLLLRADDKGQRSPLHLNPDCILCRGSQLPDELASHKELLPGFALQGTIAWVPDSAGGLPLPFWLGPQLESAVCSLAPNETVPDSMPRGVQQRLAAANILLPEDRISQLHAAPEEILRKSSRLFREKGYATLPGLIHPFHVAALRRYYRYLIRTGAIPLGDGQSPRRYAAYNEPVARFFHHRIASTLSSLAGEPLRPSYVYFASYLSGAELKKHTDREQCEFSVTLCLDFSPDPQLETPWPIRLEPPDGPVAVYQALGDGLAYRGTRLPHYRDRLADGQTSTSIFFHYVAADFAGSLD